jgi:hypothetical protein
MPARAGGSRHPLPLVAVVALVAALATASRPVGAQTAPSRAVETTASPAQLYRRARAMRNAGVVLTLLGGVLAVTGGVVLAGSRPGGHSSELGGSLLGGAAAIAGTGVVLWPVGDARMRQALELGGAATPPPVPAAAPPVAVATPRFLGVMLRWRF